MAGKVQSFLDNNLVEKNASYIWVNPDCGLKTREWKQVLPSLANMVQAAATMRAHLTAK